MAFKIPTQVIELPSRGLIYSKENPLSSGKIEMKFGGAEQEEIMANETYEKDGSQLERLFKSMIVSKIDYDDLIIGDKDAIFIASRVLMFGKNYEVSYILPGDDEPSVITIDLTSLKDKEFVESFHKSGINEFDFTLPITGVPITCKILTHKDEKLIQEEVKALKKIYKNKDKEVSVSYYYKITSVNGDRTTGTIRDFVDNGLITMDSMELHKFIYKISPGIDFRFNYTKPTGEVLEGLYLPITHRFFRPSIFA